MINELSLLKLNPEKASTKQKIISALGEQWPLTVKQIHDKITKQYNTDISYQAAHKLVQEMFNEKILEKNENAWQLNLQWIRNSKETLQQLETVYEKGKSIQTPTEFDAPLKIEFDNISEMCVATAELLVSKQLVKKGQDPDFICMLEYGWWALKFRFEYMQLLINIVRSNSQAKFLFRKKTKFGKFITEQYRKIGATEYEALEEFDLDEDIFVQGDYVIQVRLSEETRNMIKKYYEKWSGLNDSFLAIGMRAEPKAHAIMTITKNPTMAKLFRNQFYKYAREKQ